MAVHSSDLTINDIRQAIQKKWAKWIPKRHRIWRLNSKVRQRLLGALSDGQSDSIIKSKLSGQIDWRNYHGQNYIAQAVDQGQCNSCVAFGTAATLEGQLNISNHNPYFAPKLSEQYLFGCPTMVLSDGGIPGASTATKVTSPLSCNLGWNVPEAVKFVVNKGVPDWSCFPYTSGATMSNVACHAACSDAEDRLYKAQSAIPVVPGREIDLNALIEALKLGPVVAAMDVYTDFFSYSQGIYQHTSGEKEGGHVISIVGYNADVEVPYFIIKNSWGSDWGEQGFAKIKMDDVSNVGQTAYRFEIQSSKDFVALTRPAVFSILSGRTSFVLKSTFEQTQAMKVEFTQLKNNFSVNDNVTWLVPFTNPVEHYRAKILQLYDDKTAQILITEGGKLYSSGQIVEKLISLDELHLLERVQFYTEIDAEMRSGEGHEVQIDTEDLPDGIYEVEATALIQVNGNRSEVRKSTAKRIYILNENPVMNTRVVTPQDGDTISRRVAITFLVNSSPIPFEKFTIYRKNLTTGVSLNPVRSNYVSNEVKMIWDTTSQKNGTQFLIWGEGKIGEHTVTTEAITVTVNNPE